MRIAGIASLAPVTEVDPNVFTYYAEALEYHSSTLLAELGIVVLTFIDSDFRGTGVQIERIPSGGKGIFPIRMSCLVEGDAAIEVLFLHIAVTIESVKRKLRIYCLNLLMGKQYR